MRRVAAFGALKTTISFQIPPTIEDPTVYKEIEKALQPFAPATKE